MEIQKFIDFIDKSPTSYQVARHFIEEAKGFTMLRPEDSWTLEEGKGYSLVVDDGGVLLFRMRRRKR